ncbi:hypothetical protein C900_04426 [Fulvivirga imtechensis AK7]|uniref:PKD domain-containing protein n=1 Tax=Fulvivirga imtechensis AK7 TaxID=1237149 RepID=L8JR77_9BACT|nr:Ig-like domain-containing protein [Fulvivirga imtechensis]ELR69999.1 hypothetical protein C900_04426 [Fulvivirga imtechensis AK7]
MNFLKLANYKLSYTKLAAKAFMILLTILSIEAQAQIVTYSFTGSSGDETTFAPDAQPANATVSDMSRGPGLSVWTYAGGFNAYTWGATSSIDLNDYFEFTVTPDAGYSLTLTSLVFDGRYVDPIVNDTYFWTLRSSIDNFTTDIQAPTGVAATQAASPSVQVDNTVDLTGGTFDNLTSPVTFRLYVYDVTNPNNFEWGIDNVDINGTVNAPTSTIIETIDFEIANYTLNTATSTGGPPATSFFDVFAAAGEGTTHAFLGGAPTGVQGSNYLAYRNGTSIGSNNMINTTAIDVSSYENLSLIFSLANPDLGGDQYETSDIIRIEYQFDGGGYQFLTQWAGDGATYMNEDADDTGGGDGVAATLLGPLFKSFQRSIPKDGSLLDIRFTILTTNESVVIDNIAVVGTTDVTAPEVTSIVRQTPVTASTAATSVTFRVTFDEPVSNVDVTDFTLSGSASGTLNSVTANSASEYDVNITTVSGNGDNLNLDFAGGQDITDVAGNAFTGTINSEEEYVIDNTAPEVSSIIRQTPATASTTATSVTFRVTFNEDVTNVDLTDFALSGTASGTLNSITPNSATEYDINVTTVSGNGDNLNLDFAGGQDITDIIGNTFPGTINSEEEYIIDNVVPEVASIARQNPASASTNATTVTFRVTFSEGVTNVDLTDFVLSGTASGTLNAITPNSASEYDIDVVTVSGNGSLNLDFAGGQDIADIIGNDFAGTINSEEEYAIDNIAPEVASIVRQTPATASTTATSVTFRVTFDEDVANVGVADFTLSGTASGTVNAVTPNSAAEYDVNIITVSGNGDNLNLDFAGGQDITDMAGNTFAGTINSEEEYTIDNIAPEVASIVRQTPATASTTATSVTFRVTFDEDVTNVGVADFTLSGTASGTVNSVTPNSATEYDINITAVSGDGDNLNLDFSGGQDITDIIGNAFAGTINSEEEYTIDNIAPEVASIVRQSPASASTNANSVTFRITFSEGVTNVDLTDFELSGTASGTLNSITPNSASEYDIDVISVAGDGNLDLGFAGGQDITDIIGNAFTGIINSEEEYTIDNTTPQVTSIVRQNPANTLTNANTVTFRVTFNEDVANVDFSDFAISGAASGTVNAVTANSSVEYDVDITTVTGDGTLNLDFAANNIVDLAGNAFAGTINSEQEYTIDNQIPIATITLLEDGDQTTFEVTFNEQLAASTTSITNINNLLSSAINDPAGDNQPISIASVPASVSWNLAIPSAPVATITIPTTTFVAGETLRINFDDNVVQDLAGNGISSATNVDGTVADVTPPSVSPDEMSLNGSTSIQFTLSEEIDIAEGGAVSGFSTSNGTLTTAIYSGKGSTNLITLTGSGWSAGVTTVSYDPGIGDVLDLAGNELATITNHPVVVNTVNLGAGSIAFTYYRSDDPNEFAFVLLEDVEVGTQIKFTNNGWTEGPPTGFRTGEETLVWEADQRYFAGKEVVIAGSSASSGTTTGSELTLSTGGDQIIAYQGTSVNPTLLSAIHMNGNWDADNDSDNKSEEPVSQLTTGVNMLAITSETDNAAYDMSTLVGSASAIRSAINNQANWDSDDNASNGISFTVPTDGDNYTLPPDVVSFAPAHGSTVAATQSSLTITFDDNISNSTSSGADIQLKLDDGTPVATFNIGDPEVTVSGTDLEVDIAAILPLTHNAVYEVDVAEWVVVNADGNHNTAVVGDANWKFTVDGLAPTVTSITRDPGVTVNANFGTTASSVDFIVEFSENVVPGSVQTVDFTPAGAASGGTETVSNVAGSGTTYTVTVSNISLLGDLTINFTGSVNDLVGNAGSTFAAGDESFIIINPEPTEQATAFSAVAGADTYTLDASWTAGAGAQPADGYLIFIKSPSGSFPADPADLTAIANDLDFSDDNGVINSSTNSVSVSGLSSGTQYDFKIYPYTNSGNQIDYKIDGTILTGSGTTSTGQASRIILLTPASTTISSLTNNLGAAESYFRFRVIDDGLNTAVDNAPTRVSQIVIKVGAGNEIAWTEAIEGVGIFDGTGNSMNSNVNGGDIVITDTEIIFNNVPNGSSQLGEITDNSFKNYSLRVWLKNPITDAALQNTIDGLNFVFEVDETSFSYASGSSEVAAGQMAAQATEVAVVATELNWEIQPPSAAGVLAPFTSAPVIEATDANGNRDIHYAEEVTSVTNAGGIGMNNNPDASGLAHSFASGIYTFDITSGTGFNYQDAGDGTLTVTSDALAASPASGTVTVSYSGGTTISTGPATEPSTFASTIVSITDINAYSFDFNIQDDAIATIDDKVGTVITELVISAEGGTNTLTSNWSDVIYRALLYNPNTGRGVFAENAAIDDNSITFDISGSPSPTLGVIPDDGTATLRLYIAFKTAITGGMNEVIDNQYLNFKIADVQITTATASSTFLASQEVTSGATNNQINVEASRYQFKQQPIDTYINQVMTPTASIEATDVYGNRDLDYTGDATVSSSGTGTQPADQIVNFTLGLGTIPSLIHDKIENNLQLDVTDNSNIFTSIQSNPFNILPGAAESDIIASAFSYNTNIDYTSYQATSVTDTDPTVFEFEIRDGEADGVSGDADALPTNVTTLTFDVFNHSLLRKIGLFDDSNTLIAEVDPAAQISFDLSGSPLVIPDDGSATYNLKVTFSNVVTDNAQFSFTVSQAVADDQGSTFSSTNGAPDAGTAAVSSTAGDNNRIEVTASKIVFDNIVSASLNTDFSPVVRALDINDNLDLDFTETIDTYSNTSTTPGGSLATVNDPSGSFAGGIFTFPANFQFTASGQGVTIYIETASFNTTSNSFDIISSFESYITYVSDGGSIPYIDYPPVVNLDETNSDIIAEFMLHDGNPSLYGNDVDGAATTIDELTISISNFENLDLLGIFDAGGTQYGTDMTAAATVTFTGVNFSAADDATNNFYIRATFKDSDTDITDNAPIDIVITSVVASNGSQFEDATAGGETDGLGGYILAQTPAGNNRIQVTATILVFTQSPGALEGMNVPFASSPYVEAQDANGNLDTDFNKEYNLTSEVAPLDLSAVPTTFTAGTLDLSTLRYTGTGYGTLTIEDNPLEVASGSSGAPGSTDVVNTNVAQLTNGIRSNANPLNAGSIDVPILGFRLASLSNTTGEPELNEVTIQFQGTDVFDIQTIFESFRLFRSGDEEINLGTFIDETLITGITINTTANSVTFSGLSEILDNNTTNQNLFLVVNISDEVNALTTPAITPYVEPTDYVVSSGSLFLVDGGVVASLTGLQYTFIDEQAPEIVSLTPADNDPNVSPLSDLIITFNEPVNSLDNEITLRKPSDALFNEKVPLFSTSPDRKTFTFRPSASLDADEDYYVQIAAGSTVNNTGFTDDSGNTFSGIQNSTTWNFKTSDITPPVFINPIPVLVSNIYDLGFDLGVRIDEPGTVFYIVIGQADPNPTAAQIFDPGTYTGELASGTINITVPEQYHYAAITSLAANTDFEVWVIAEDNALPSPNRMTTPVSVSGTTASGSSAGTVVDAPAIDICFGEYQPILPLITIREGANGDFSGGNGQTLNLVLPSGFEFNTSPANAQVQLSGGNISNGSLTFVNNSILRITYDISGTNSRDRITLTGLEVRATSSTASGNITRIGGTAIQNGNAESDNLNHGSISVIPPTAANFTFSTGSSSIGNDADPVTLIPDPSLEVSGTNVFTGNGVFGNTFYPQVAGVNDHNVTLTHTTDLGCVSTETKVMTVFDNVSAIPGVNAKYCTTGSIIPGVNTVAINENDKTGYRLTDLYLDVSAYVGADAAYTGLGALTASGNNYVFDIDVAGQNLNQGIVYVDLVATYQSKTDATEFLEFRKPVAIADPPNVALNFVSSGPANINDYCEDGETIILEGDYAKSVHTEVTNVFELVGQTASAQNVLNTTDENVRIEPNDIINHADLGFRDQPSFTYTLRYELTNRNTGCSSEDTQDIVINRKPGVNFSAGVSCVGLETQFTDLSIIPGDVTLAQWRWDFDDFANNTETIQNPVHEFTGTGSYDVRLGVRTEKGCVNEITRSVAVGGIPQPLFSYIGVNRSDTFIFESSTPKPGSLPGDLVNILTWNFGDGSSYVSNSNGEQVTHQYTNLMIDSVELIIETTLGCTSTLKKPVAVLDKITDATSQSAGFENGSEGWVVLPGANNSWTLSNNNADIGLDGNTLWVTNANASYLPKEKSYLYSPTYDISSLERPMIQFDAFTDLSTGDGVILQYSTDSLNITDPTKTWIAFGSIGSGVDWYNGDNLASKPGESTDIGWADSLGMIQPKHSLATVPGAKRTNLNFRFALASVNDPTNNPGFAFDNLFIGERTRTVLIENFTNTSQISTTKSESDFIKKLLANDNEGVEVININYHTDFPGPDPINNLNQADPSARAVFYNINTTPRAVIDGFIYQDAPFSSWGESQFELRSLSLSPFDIEISTSTANDRLEVEAVFTPKTINDNIDNLLIYIAVLEQEITLDELNMSAIPSGEDTLTYALRKILPHAAGTKIPASVLALNIQSDPITVSWVPVNIDLDDIAIVVFIQDEDTREIYQAEILKNVDLSILSTVTGTDALNPNSFNIYPNPANKQVTIQLKDRLGKDASLRIYDGFGKVVFEHQIDSKGSIDIDTRDYAAGLYHVQIEDDETIVRKRLMIMHR